MHLKQKIIKDKSQQPTIRYNLQVQNCNSIPVLVKFNNQSYQEKQNVLDHLNKSQFEARELSKSNEFEIKRSIDIAKRFSTSVHEEQLKNKGKDQNNKGEQNKLSSSHNFANFRKKQKKSLYQSTDFNEHLTFGPINPIKQQRKLATSRDFYQQKRLKTESINEIITNVKSSLSKNSNEFSVQGQENCANHLTKQAKYRLLSELSEGEQEMFYCSKCAINLLQQGFKIQQIRKEEDNDDNQINQIRYQHITKIELKLKSLQERTITEIQRNQQNQNIDTIQQQIITVNQQFQNLMQVINQLRNQKINELKEVCLQNQYSQKVRRQNYRQIAKDLQYLQSEINDYKTNKKFSCMKENEYQFMISSLTNKIHNFEEMVQSASVLNAPLISIENLSNDQIFQLLQSRILQMKEGETSNSKQYISNKQCTDQNIKSGDQFICNQKKPFRILFPSDQRQLNFGQKDNQKKIILRSMHNSFYVKQH